MKRTSRSLVRQTLAAVLLSQCLCALLLCGAALLHERHTHYMALDIRLEGRADSVLGAIQDAEDPDDNVFVDPAELHLPDDDVFAVYNLGGRYLSGSAQGSSDLITRGADGFREVHQRSRTYRVLQRSGLRIIDRAETKGLGLRRPVTIVYATPEYHIWHRIFEAARFDLIASILAACITALLVAMLLRKLLQPIADLSAAAEAISVPALAFTPPPSVLHLQELRPLADVLTTSIARLRESFEKERRFVSDAAHELKTAVAVVRSSLQLLLLKPRSQQEYITGLERVIEDNLRVEAVVTQMLTLAALQENTTDVQPLLDLAQSCAASVSSLQPIAQERRLTLTYQGSATAPVRLRPDDATTLVNNLVMNALQHSQPGSAVQVTLLSNATHEVTLQVIDEGCGIAASALPHIFDRFYRVDSSRSRGTGGTGLGLSICKSIVVAAGGTIQVESQPGQGTSVVVVLRAA